MVHLATHLEELLKVFIKWILLNPKNMIITIVWIVCIVLVVNRRPITIVVRVSMMMVVAAQTSQSKAQAKWTYGMAKKIKKLDFQIVNQLVKINFMWNLSY